MKNILWRAYLWYLVEKRKIELEDLRRHREEVIDLSVKINAVERRLGGFAPAATNG